MLDFGFSEILLTSAIALVVLGPERLPKVARQVGNWMGRARAMARQLSEQLEREVSAEELLKEQNKQTTSAENRIGPQAAAPPQYVLPEPQTALVPDAHMPLPDPPPPDPQTAPSQTAPSDGHAKLFDPHSSPSGLASKSPNE
jgi:sec-independent protein translocase protein TatB